MQNITVISTQSNNKFSSSYYCLSILLEGHLRTKRKKIIEYLNNQGIGTSIYYPKILPELSYYKKIYKIDKKKFINADNISNYSICLPIGPHVNKKNLQHIINKLYEINKLK